MTALEETCRWIWMHMNARPVNNFHAMSNAEIWNFVKQQRPYVEFLQMYERQCVEDLKQAKGELAFEAGELEVALGVLDVRSLSRADER